MGPFMENLLREVLTVHLAPTICNYGVTFERQDVVKARGNEMSKRKGD